MRPPVSVAFGLYHREWRFASTGELRDTAFAVIAGTSLIVVLLAAAAALGLPGTSPFPRSFLILEPILTFVLVGGGRFFVRMRLEGGVGRNRRSGLVPTLIYGAGDAGAGIARTAARDQQLGVRVVGFLDDDTRMAGSRLLGHRVFGSIDDLPAAAERTGARQLLIAMPSKAGTPIRRALAAAQKIGMDVKTVPPIRDLITGEIRLARPRAIMVEDLLRREPVTLDTAAIAGYLNGASVLVTGGGGSIGGELVQQILRIGPRILTVVDYHEAALWNLERDAGTLLKVGSGVRLNAVLADVRSAAGMQAVIGRAKPDVVFHAAALKHVPYVEMHPSEGAMTNVIGTRNVLEACEAARVPRFVLISTDKAVEPAGVMGWTKRLAELLTIRAGLRTGLPYAAVRFGNVLGSSGSLIPLLERQLEDGLPLTITEPDATRFFMTLSEAVMLIIEAGAAGEPGQTYVLDMGEPVRIGDLVREVVRLKGIADEVAEYHVTGLRPGEKLHEKLFSAGERAVDTGHPGIRRAVMDDGLPLEELAAFVASIEVAAAARDDDRVRMFLRDADRRYSHSGASPVAD